MVTELPHLLPLVPEAKANPISVLHFLGRPHRWPLQFVLWYFSRYFGLDGGHF